jgi:hypothetical protein
MDILDEILNQNMSVSGSQIMNVFALARRTGELTASDPAPLMHEDANRNRTLHHLVETHPILSDPQVPGNAGSPRSPLTNKAAPRNFWLRLESILVRSKRNNFLFGFSLQKLIDLSCLLTGSDPRTVSSRGMLVHSMPRRGNLSHPSSSASDAADSSDSATKVTDEQSSDSNGVTADDLVSIDFLNRYGLHMNFLIPEDDLSDAADMADVADISDVPDVPDATEAKADLEDLQSDSTQGTHASQADVVVKSKDPHDQSQTEPKSGSRLGVRNISAEETLSLRTLNRYRRLRLRPVPVTDDDSGKDGIAVDGGQDFSALPPRIVGRFCGCCCCL